jgi:hypothetical protein
MGKVIAKITTPSNPSQRPRISTAVEGFIEGRREDVGAAVYEEHASVPLTAISHERQGG